MPSLFMCPGLFAWTLTLEGGAQRTVLASSLRAAVGFLPVTAATKGTGFTPAPAPVLATLVPATAKVGDANFTLHVTGTGFKAGDTILWNGSPEPTTFVSATEVTTGVNMATATTPAAIPVSVRTITGLESNVLTFTLQPAA